MQNLENLDIYKLLNGMNDGFAYHCMVYDEDGMAEDYEILYVNPSFEKILNISGSMVIGKLASDAYEVGEAPYLDVYARVVATGKVLFGFSYLFFEGSFCNFFSRYQ